MTVAEKFLNQPRRVVLAEAGLMVALIGVMDYLADWEVSFFIVYGLPIAVATRKAGRRMGIAFAIFCTFSSWLAETSSSPYKTNWGFALGTASRMFYFTVLVLAVAAAKAREESDAERIRALERASVLEGELFRVSEREQRRIGRDLHDGLGPHLAAIGYAATFLRNDLSERGAPEAGRAEEIRGMADAAVSLARDIARGAFTVQMDATGLSVALEELARTTAAQTRTAVSFCETGNTRIANSEAATHLYMIAREAVNNALKHAAAGKIAITLNRSADSLRLEIADDGRGMDPAKDPGSGIGVHSMQYRARALGASLEIESNPGAGTTVSCSLPSAAG